MAGGKESPRQQMINLMYLVFIAMLALNMSKEVLSAFGQINESLVESSKTLEEKNKDALQGLATKAADQPEQFKAVKEKADLVNQHTKELFNYFQNVKEIFESSVDDPKDYETMDKDAAVNEYFMKSGKLKPEGEEFIANMVAYRDRMTGLLEDDAKYASIVNTINDKFSADKPIRPRDAAKTAEVDYVEHHFVGYPMISTITKISNLQHDMKILANEIYSLMLAGQLTQIASMDNYETLLQTDRGAYYQGSTFDGSIVLGRTDASTVPNRVELTLDGKPLSEGKDYEIKEGQVKLNVPTGPAGDRKIEGKLIFTQGDEDIEVDVNQMFQVIPKPEQAIVSADKMNVVYRGIDNPITVSIPGIPANKVKASADGLTNVSGTKYNLVPKTGQEVKINVIGEIDGEPVNSPPVVFRIKSLPRPTPTVRGEFQEGAPISMPRKALEISPVGAEFENFDFDIKPVVKRFSVSIPGQPAVTVNGDRFDAAAKQLLNLANAGDVIQVFDIKADVPGVNVKNMPPIQVKLSN